MMLPEFGRVMVDVGTRRPFPFRRDSERSRSHDNAIQSLAFTTVLANVRTPSEAVTAAAQACAA